MRTQRGIGLVEMMVAITIGMVMVLGLAQMFVSMKNTAVLRDKLSSVQSNERVAMMFMETSLRGAGYNPSPTVSGINVAFPAAGVFTTAGQALYGTGTGTAPHTDTLSVRFYASTNATGQQGCSPTLSAGHLYTDVFSVNTASNYLVCTETDNTTGTTAAPINLISGVTGMDTLYGIDTYGVTTSSKNVSVTEYLPPNSVGSYWGSVSMWNYSSSIKTITITLYFANPLAGQAGQPATVSLSETLLYTLGM
jgi:type IV pilus assembly protein PilW